MARQFSVVFFFLFLFSSDVSAKPNILLVIADDMGLDASPCHDVGASSAKMPVLSKLCATGTVFDLAYTAPTCSPTRAAIMTGKFGFRLGIGGAISPRNKVSLSSNETSLFDVFARHAKDYRTALFGKWHLAPFKGNQDHPASLGVSNYFGIYSGATKDYFDWSAVENGKTVKIDKYTTTEFADRAIKWVGERGADPWFLWLAFNAPHTPFHAPPKDLHSYSGLTGSKSDIRQNPKKYYFAALQALDSEVGRLLETMSPEVRKNTVVIFLGDNGSPLRVARDIYGERGAKGSVFDGGTHVPLVISGPKISAGRSSALVNSTDLFATIANLAGIKTAMPSDSINLAPALAGKPSLRSFAYAEHFSKATIKGKGSYGWSIRDERFKLVQPEGHALMMFDMKSDPLEKIDLLKQPLSEVAKIAKIKLLENYETLHK